MSSENDKFVIPGNLVNKIKKLNCPLLESKDDWWIQNILFSRSEYYSELLRWIETTVQERYGLPALDNNFSKYIFRDITIKDQEGFESGGCDSILKINSWNKLLDIYMYLLQSIHQDGTSPTKGTTERLPNAKLKNTYESTIVQLDSIAEHSLTKNFFPLHAPALPLDIEKELQIFSRNNTESISFKSSSDLEEAKMTSVREVRQQEIELQSLLAENDGKCNIIEEGSELQKVEAQLNRAKISLLELIGEFDDCYKRLKPLLGKQQTAVPTDGEYFQNAHKKMKVLMKILEEFCTISSCSEIREFQTHVQTTSRENSLPGFLSSRTEEIISSLKNLYVQQ